MVVFHLTEVLKVAKLDCHYFLNVMLKVHIVGTLSKQERKLLISATTLIIKGVAALLLCLDHVSVRPDHREEISVAILRRKLLVVFFTTIKRGM